MGPHCAVGLLGGGRWSVESCVEGNPSCYLLRSVTF